MEKIERILLIHGPNMNLMGIARDPKKYGTKKLCDLEKDLIDYASTKGAILVTKQSNHEGVLIDFIQEQREWAQAICINPAALAHSSIALRDALEDSALLCVEVHYTDISQREEFRKVSLTGQVCKKIYSGKGEASYKEALNFLFSYHL